MALGTAAGSSFFGHCYDVFVNGQYLFNTCGLPPPPPVPLPETPDLGGTGVGTGTGTGAEVEDKSTADTATDTCTAGCPNCPPQAGAFAPFPVNGRPTGLKGAAYQFYVNGTYGIAGQFPYAGGTIVEWLWAGIRWDGFVSGLCHLLEAKADHSSWFVESWGPGARPMPKDKFVQRVLLKKIHTEATNQYRAVSPLQPRVQLTWHFSGMVFKLYFTEWLLSNTELPNISLVIRTVHLPFV